MPEDWDRVSSDVLEAIDDVGFSVTLTKRPTKVGPEYARVSEEPEVLSMRAVSLRNKVFGYAQGMPTRYDEVLLVPVENGIDPVEKDSVEVNGTKYTVDSIESISPGGVVVAKKLMLRR